MSGFEGCGVGGVTSLPLSQQLDHGQKEPWEGGCWRASSCSLCDPQDLPAGPLTSTRDREGQRPGREEASRPSLCVRTTSTGRSVLHSLPAKDPGKKQCLA